MNSGNSNETEALPVKPSCPPIADAATGSYDLPPPYTPYDPNKQVPQQDFRENFPIGFQALSPTGTEHYGPVSQNHYFPQSNASQVIQAPGSISMPIIHQIRPPIAAVIPLGPDSARMTCPFCHMDVTTSVTKVPSTVAFISSFILCFLGCVYGCCLIPFCVDACKTSKHHCPACKKCIAKYNHGC